MLIGSIHLVNI